MTNFADSMWNPFAEGPDYSAYIKGPMGKQIEDAAKKAKTAHNLKMHDYDVHAAKYAIDAGCPTVEAARILILCDYSQSYNNWFEEGDDQNDDELAVEWMQSEFKRLGLVEQKEVTA